MKICFLQEGHAAVGDAQIDVVEAVAGGAFIMMAHVHQLDITGVLAEGFGAVIGFNWLVQKAEYTLGSS